MLARKKPHRNFTFVWWRVDLLFTLYLVKAVYWPLKFLPLLSNDYFVDLTHQFIFLQVSSQSPLLGVGYLAFVNSSNKCPPWCAASHKRCLKVSCTVTKGSSIFYVRI